MRKFLALCFFSAALASCSHFGQFEEPIRELVQDWDRNSALAADLAGMAAAQQERLDSIMYRNPARTGLVGNFGEDYLSRSDQLSARLIGHKGRFDELAQRVRDFAGEWEQKQLLIDELRRGLAEGRLAGRTPEQIRALQAFIADHQERITTWSEQLAEVVRQFDSTAGQLKH